jgi:hypothetical protein
MKKRLGAFVIGVCSILAIATPVSAAGRTPTPAPSGLAPFDLCLDLIIIQFPCH